MFICAGDTFSSINSGQNIHSYILWYFAKGLLIVHFEMNQCNNIFKIGLVSNCNFLNIKLEKVLSHLAHAYRYFSSSYSLNVTTFLNFCKNVFYHKMALF